MSYEQDQHRDVIDLILAGAKTVRTVSRPSGELEDVEMPDAETIYWMTRDVASDEFSNFAFQINMLESLAEQAPYAMSAPRAQVIVSQIRGVTKAFKHAINSKSSEAIRNKRDKQSTLVDKIARHREEKVMVLKDKSKSKSIGQYFGKRDDGEEDEMR